MHEGVDIDFVKPDPRTEGVIAARNVTLRPGDEIVTYVARNLEPYRDYHVIKRALPESLRPRPKVQQPEPKLRPGPVQRAKPIARNTSTK